MNSTVFHCRWKQSKAKYHKQQRRCSQFRQCHSSGRYSKRISNKNNKLSNVVFIIIFVVFHFFLATRFSWLCSARCWSSTITRRRKPVAAREHSIAGMCDSFKISTYGLSLTLFTISAWCFFRRKLCDYACLLIRIQKKNRKHHFRIHIHHHNWHNNNYQLNILRSPLPWLYLVWFWVNLCSELIEFKRKKQPDTTKGKKYLKKMLHDKKNAKNKPIKPLQQESSRRVERWVTAHLCQHWVSTQWHERLAADIHRSTGLLDFCLSNQQKNQ